MDDVGCVWLLAAFPFNALVIALWVMVPSVALPVPPYSFVSPLAELVPVL